MDLMFFQEIVSFYIYMLFVPYSHISFHLRYVALVFIHCSIIPWIRLMISCYNDKAEHTRFYRLLLIKRCLLNVFTLFRSAVHFLTFFLYHYHRYTAQQTHIHKIENLAGVDAMTSIKQDSRCVFFFFFLFESHNKKGKFFLFTCVKCSRYRDRNELRV